MNDIKESILKKTFELYHKFGIRSVTMDDVSRELGMSKKTLYTYFSDKHSLVEEAMLYIRKVNTKKWGAEFEESENAIEEMLKVNMIMRFYLKNEAPSMDYDLKKYYPDIFQKINEYNFEMMYKGITENIVKGKKEGYYRTEIKEDVIGSMLVARVEGLKSCTHERINANMDVEFHNEVFIYHLRGIANAKGIEYLEKNIARFTDQQ